MRQRWDRDEMREGLRETENNTIVNWSSIIDRVMRYNIKKVCPWSN
jgi:hypothetical protein